MNKDQIIQMAREAGLIHETHEGNWHLEQFAKLIRAATKEEDAKICDKYAYALDNGNNTYMRSHEAFEIAQHIRASK